MKNDNESKERVRQMIKQRIAISNIGEEVIMEKKKNKKLVYAVLSACASLVLISGIVIATHIKSNKVISSIENVKIIENVGVDVNVKEIQLNDYNLTTNIALRFDNSIQEKVDIKEVYAVDLLDFIVRDEENKIIYSMASNKSFEEYCIENNLDYKLGNFEENYLNCGLNQFIENKENNLVEINHTIYSDNNKLPKSNKLYYSFKKIRLWVLDTDTQKVISYELKGDWNFEVDVL